MGETQLYSQRLHGINEKRRILSDVDRIQRELELQKLKLQQLKRKSLRDRWLMDGLVPASGIEIENPLSQTEDTIHNLEQELENLQSELMYLENPELSIAKAKKIQETTIYNNLANGDRKQQAVDRKETHEEKTTSDIEAQKEEKPTIEPVDPSQKGSTQGASRQVGQPIPAPRGIKIQGKQQEGHKEHQEEHKEHQEEHKVDEELPIEQSQSQKPPNQNSEHNNQNEHHKSLKEDNEIQNINHSRVHGNEEAERIDQSGKLDGQCMDQEHFDRDQNLNHQNAESLDSEEHEKQNLEDLAQDYGNADLNVHNEGDKKETLLPNTTTEEQNIQNQNDNVELLGTESHLEIFNNQTENESTIQHETQPTLPTAGQHQDGELTDSDHKKEQNMDENVILKSGVHDQIQDEDRGLTQPVDDKKKNQLSPFHDQNLHVLPIYKDQGLVLPSEGQVKITTTSKDQDLNVWPQDEDQKQSSQVKVIPTPGLDQHSANPQPGPSATHHSSTVITNTPAESQPLLDKPQETDASRQPHGTNTAETRDKETPVKKKTCQCCVVM